MGRHYYNNGIEQGLYEEGEQPEGWTIGRLTIDEPTEQSVDVTINTEAPAEPVITLTRVKPNKTLKPQSCKIIRR